MFLWSCGKNLKIGIFQDGHRLPSWRKNSTVIRRDTLNYGLKIFLDKYAEFFNFLSMFLYKIAIFNILGSCFDYIMQMISNI